MHVWCYQLAVIKDDVKWFMIRKLSSPFTILAMLEMEFHFEFRFSDEIVRWIWQRSWLWNFQNATHTRWILELHLILIRPLLILFEQMRWCDAYLVFNGKVLTSNYHNSRSWCLYLRLHWTEDRSLFGVERYKLKKIIFIRFPRNVLCVLSSWCWEKKSLFRIIYQ